MLCLQATGYFQSMKCQEIVKKVIQIVLVYQTKPPKKKKKMFYHHRTTKQNKIVTFQSLKLGNVWNTSYKNSKPLSK